MPGFDGTGPLGQGPRTGRGLGPCNSNQVNINNKNQSDQPLLGVGRGGRPRGGGRGLAFGGGRRRLFSRWFRGNG